MNQYVNSKMNNDMIWNEMECCYSNHHSKSNSSLKTWDTNSLIVVHSLQWCLHLISNSNNLIIPQFSHHTTSHHIILIESWKKTTLLTQFDCLWIELNWNIMYYENCDWIVLCLSFMIWLSYCCCWLLWIWNCVKWR